MEASDKKLIDGRFFRTLVRLRDFFTKPTPRGNKHANSKKIKRVANLVRLQKKAAMKRAYASRRINHKRAKGVN